MLESQPSLVTQNIYYAASSWLVNIYARIMLRVNIQFLEALPKGPKIIAANHPSTSDPLYITLPFSEPLALMLIENPFRVPVLGNILKASGHIPVAVDKKDKRKALEPAREMLGKGKSVVIFPEGDTTPPSGELLPAKTGIARLVAATQVPVIPVGIYLDRKRIKVIKSGISGKPTIGYWYLRGPYYITIGDKMVPETDLREEQQIKSFSAKIMEKISHLARESEKRASMPHK